MVEAKSNSFLETEKLGVLMRKYALPCIISLLVGALYNIVDQIFIANASYLGSYGNAANSVVFPLLLPLFFGLDGILYFMPAADILTFIVTVVVIIKTGKELSAPIRQKGTQDIY